MRLLALFCFLALGMPAAMAVGQEVKKDDITYDMKHLEKIFGLKFKSAKLAQGKTKDDTLVTITLEFTKDCPETSGVFAAGGLQEMRKSFAGKEASMGAFSSTGPMVLKCYLFDADGVAFAKQPPGQIQGEVSGVKGDAFRIAQTVPNAVLAKVRKISFREEPPPEKSK